VNGQIVNGQLLELSVMRNQSILFISFSVHIQAKTKLIEHFVKKTN